MNNEFQNFINRFENFVIKNPNKIETLLSNIFTMRLIGNKTHGDLAEIAICEFINKYLNGFNAKHVGKDLFRAKNREEDIEIENTDSKLKFPISLKAYGEGPLQLSTDKKSELFSLLENYSNNFNLDDIFETNTFKSFESINTISLIYNEKRMECNILIFDFEKIKNETRVIIKESVGKNRIHPVYKFLDRAENYLFEIRYGGSTANALQRGVWTNTNKTLVYFRSLTDGWMRYQYNFDLLRLMSEILIANKSNHVKCLVSLKE